MGFGDSPGRTIAKCLSVRSKREAIRTWASLDTLRRWQAASGKRQGLGSLASFGRFQVKFFSLATNGRVQYICGLDQF